MKGQNFVMSELNIYFTLLFSQAEMGKKEELKNKDILSSDKFSEGLFLFSSFKS